MGVQPLTYIYQLVSTNKLSKAETNLVKGFLKVALKRGKMSGSVKRGSVKKASVKRGSVKKGSPRKVKMLSLKPTPIVSKFNTKTLKLMKTAAAAGGSRK